MALGGPPRSSYREYSISSCWRRSRKHPHPPRHLLAARERSAAATRPPEPGANQTANCAADVDEISTCFPHAPKNCRFVTIRGGMARHLFFGGGTVVLRNALAPTETARPRAVGRREGRAGSRLRAPEKPIHLPGLRLGTRHACHHSCRGSRVGCNNTERKQNETGGRAGGKLRFLVIFRSRPNRTTPRYQLRKLSRVTID